MSPVPLPSTPLPFDFKDPKGISAVCLSLDSPLEPIVGYAKGISGTLAFDPAHPERSTGKVAIAASSVQFANDGYTATAQGYALNAKRWPELTLTLRKVERVRKVSPTRYEGTVLADFTCRGVTRSKRLAVTADYLPGRAEERTNGRYKGDLLVLRTHFSVSRKEHGISEGIPDAMVGDSIEVGVAVVGIHYAAPKPDARWEVELAKRDDPALLRFERYGDRLSVAIAGRTIDGHFTSGSRFQLAPNAFFGEAAGEIDAAGRGVLHLKDGDVLLKGHPVEAFGSFSSAPAKGTGLPALGLARRMMVAGTSEMAVAQIVDDRVAGVGLYGVRRPGAATPVTNSTLFQAGTMGIPVLHLAILRLAAERRIDVGRPANAYLGAEAIPEGPHGWGARITVRDLLRGTSGFAYTKSGGVAPDGVVPGLRASLGELVVTNEPGTIEEVSATNEALLERIIAHATARPATAVVRDEVLAPLGMNDSTYDVHPPTAAQGHYFGGEPTLDAFHVYPDALGNGLWTSPRDFSRLLVEVGKLIGGRPNVLLAERDRPLLAQFAAPKSVLGLRTSDDGGFYLGGDPYGFYCEFFLKPKRGQGILVMQNRMMAWQLTNEIVEAIRKTPVTPTPMSAPLARLDGGRFQSLDEVRGKGNLIVFFLNEQCGVTVFYRDRLRRLERDFAGKGFAFAAVRTGRKENPNQPVDLPERAYLRMPFFDDTDGGLMRAFGVGQSMTFAVFDRAGRLRYFGGLDDNVDPKRVSRTPLRDALRALAVGRVVRVPRAPAFGCAILPVER